MEITARELGYKNLINRKELGTVEVVGFNEEIIQYLHLDTIYYDEYSKLEAIKLTEDWLFKFGFEYITMGIFLLEDFSVIKWEGEKLEYRQWNGDGTERKRVYLEYVHQLQNLYYALTQTELTLTK